MAGSHVKELGIAGIEPYRPPPWPSFPYSEMFVRSEHESSKRAEKIRFMNNEVESF